ncbi:MAG: hypothetical protein WCR78_07575 [Arcobacteraceae bacterium]
MVKIKPIYNILDYRSIFFNQNGNISNHYRLLEDYLNYIEESVIKYRENFNTLEELSKDQMPRLNDDIHNKLYGLYDLDNEVTKALKSEIKKHHKSQRQTYNGLKCVYCGIKRQEAEDLDHYLPRSIFPAYSILSYNLIFVCKTCNQDFKKALFVEDDGSRCIINPYFDEIEIYNFLKCTIDFDETTSFSIKYEVVNPDGMNNPKLLKVVKNHFSRLNLNERYCHVIGDDCWIEFTNIFTEYDDDDNQYFIGCINEYNLEIDSRIRALGRTHPSDFEKLFWQALKENQTWLSNLPNRDLKTGQIINI